MSLNSMTVIKTKPKNQENQYTQTKKTYVGNILVTVNPYQKLPIYDEKTMNTYQNQGMSNKNLAPHIFALSDEAYSNMRSTRMQVGGTGNQVIVISGESGAGKTESSKLIFQYLAFLSEKSSQEISEKILMANPVLEAFGNAKTVRNDNSSRFGKFVKIQYSQRGDIIGSKIEIFLLEKSRITSLAIAEMNYHIFYSLLSGAPETMKKSFSLGKPEEYHYLNQSNLVSTQFYESLSYPNLREAMLLLGFTQSRLESIFKTVASILHLGNVNFAEKEANNQESKEIYVKNSHELEIASSLLKIDKTKLEEVMTFRTIKKIKSPNTIEKAISIRDAISKALYSHIFRFLVDTINATNSCEKEHSFIGVLDIFGFENFKSNSLEQLCINLANERLQQYFNNSIFSVEQEVYKQEGISWESIEFSSNQDCLDLIEKSKAEKDKPLGLLQILDDECKLLNSTDSGVLEKFMQSHADKSPRYVKPAHPNGTFGILHYAGKVEYTITGFLDKNQDSVSQEVIMLFFDDCGDSFIKELFNKDQMDLVSSMRSGSKRHANLSVSSKFRNSLNELMDTLNSSNPLFIRCIKPNVVKSAAMFTPKVVLEQLRYTGMLETVRIRRSGYSKRIPFNFFAQRYSKLCKSMTNVERDICLEIVTQVFPQGNPSLWQVGKAKVFLREEAYNSLEKEVLLHNGKLVLRALRYFHDRSRFVAAKKAAVLIQKNFRIYRAEKAKKELKEAQILLNKAILIHASRKYFEHLRNEAEKQKTEAVLFIQECIRMHMASKKLEKLKRIKSAREMLEEQKIIKKEEKKIESAMMRIKAKQSFSEVQPSQNKFHDPKSSHTSPFFIGLRTKYLEDQSQYETFGNFSIDVKKEENFTLEEYSNAHFAPGLTFKWTQSISRSLHDDLDHHELSLMAFYCIYDYMEGKSNRNDNINKIINLAVKNSEIKNEIYCQIIHQLRDNPNPGGNEKGFHLLIFCISSFLPDEDFIDFLIAFLKRSSVGTYKNLSDFCLSRLKWACHNRYHLRFFPHKEEIRITKEQVNLSGVCNPKVPIKIFSFSGKEETFDIDFSCQGKNPEFIDQLSNRFQIPKKYKYEFGLFVQFHNEQSMVEDNEYILDVISMSETKSEATGHEYCLVYKRRAWINFQSEDFSNLEILKISLPEIYENFSNGFLHLSNHDLPIAIALAFKAHFGTKSDDQLRHFLKNFCPMDKRDGSFFEELLNTSLKHLKDMETTGQTQATVSFVNLVSSSPLFGHWLSRVKVGEKNQVIMGVSTNEIVFVSPVSKEKIASFNLSDIDDIQDISENATFLILNNKGKKQKIKLQGSSVPHLEKAIRMYALHKIKKN